jgi:hypothetical protein
MLMPRRNRVTPFGTIIATPERGTLMGNRGLLHDPEERITRPWRLSRWLLCVLEYKGRRRPVMAPGHYTELFFLDEATGLAAGHRPCAECQRNRYNEFRDAWAIAHRDGDSSARPSAVALDGRLHADRLGTNGRQRTFRASLDDLPDGVFICLDESRDVALLIRGGFLFAWSPAGYRERLPRKKGAVVSVLTPKSTVAAIRAGFVPHVHPSALDEVLCSRV